MRNLIVIMLLGVLGGCTSYQSVEQEYQLDADKVRATHLLEWAHLIEEYQGTTGRYPLQDRLVGDQIILVQIATREQQVYLNREDARYARGIDNKGQGFTSVPVKAFVADIESVLKRDIDERYDPQRVPTSAPIYMSYFVTRNGYLIWTVCRTCPPQSNSFSTLLWTGTPSINIGSRWFIDNIAKTQSIESLQANKEFTEFFGMGPTRRGWFTRLEQEQVDESKH